MRKKQLWKGKEGCGGEGLVGVAAVVVMVGTRRR